MSNLARSGYNTLREKVTTGSSSIYSGAKAKCTEITKKMWGATCNYTDRATTWLDREILDLTKKGLHYIMKDDSRCEQVAEIIRTIIYSAPLTIAINCAQYQYMLGFYAVWAAAHVIAARSITGNKDLFSQRTYQNIYIGSFAGFSIDTLRNLAHFTKSPNPVACIATSICILVTSFFGYRLYQINHNATPAQTSVPPATDVALAQAPVIPVLVDERATPVHSGRGKGKGKTHSMILRSDDRRPANELVASRASQSSATGAAITPAVMPVLENERATSQASQSSATGAATTTAVLSATLPALEVPATTVLQSSSSSTQVSSSSASLMVTSAISTPATQPVVESIQTTSAPIAPVVVASLQSTSAPVSNTSSEALSTSTTASATQENVQPGRGKGMGKTHIMTLRSDVQPK
jgi:hypothetical protein